MGSDPEIEVRGDVAGRDRPPVSPWQVDSWPAEASREAVRSARDTLYDAPLPETGASIYIGADAFGRVLGVSKSSAARYLREGCQGPSAKLCACLRWFDAYDIRVYLDD